MTSNEDRLKKLESLIVKCGAYLAKGLLYDEEAKPGVREVERWRDAAMDLLMYSKQVCGLGREQESELQRLQAEIEQARKLLADINDHPTQAVPMYPKTRTKVDWSKERDEWLERNSDE